MLSAIPQTDLITGFLSFLFTLLILSYLVGDNPAFRMAVHIFTGVSAGYIVLVAFQTVLNMFAPLIIGSSPDRFLLIIPLILSLLLFGKTSSRFEWMGRPVVAFMVWVGTAAVIGGAVLGTLFPQIMAASSMFDLHKTTGPVNAAGSLTAGVLVLIGTIVTLIYFQFTLFGKNKVTGKRGKLIGFISLIGQIFIVITLGVIFSGVLSAALAALVDRINSLILFIDHLLAFIA